MGNSLTLKPAAPEGGLPDGRTNPAHIALQATTSTLTGTQLGYTLQTQPAEDGNSVDMDRERAAFVDNSVRYEAALRFIGNQSKTILSAIQGQ